MTDEDETELIKEATDTIQWRNISMIDRPLFVRGYILGASKYKDEARQGKEIVKNLLKEFFICPLNEKQQQIKEQVEQFLTDEKIKQKFNEWLEENGGKEGTLYQTFPDDELEHIFMSAYAKNNG